MSNLPEIADRGNSPPIKWLIEQINNLLKDNAIKFSETLSDTIAPIIALCFSIYLILILINYMRGAESEPLLDFLMRIASWSIIIGLGFSSNLYTTSIIPIVTDLGNDLAGLLNKGDTKSALDNLALFYIKIIENGYTKTDSLAWYDKIPVYIALTMKQIMILLGLVPFLVAATVSIIVANVGATIIATVGPLFFGFLLFPATRQYFSSWLNAAISYALIPLFISVIAGISVGVSNAVLGKNANLHDATTTDVFYAAICNLALIYLLKTAATLASSLSAGGINIGSPGGIGSAASAISKSAKGMSRDVMSADKGLGKALGVGIGSDGKPTGRTSGTAHLVRKLMNKKNEIKPG